MYRKAIFAARELEKTMSRIDADQKHSVSYSIATDGDLVRVRIIKDGIEVSRAHCTDWASALVLSRSMLTSAIVHLEVASQSEAEPHVNHYADIGLT